IGNLSPEQLEEDPDYQRIRGIDGDAWPALVELADRADAEVDGAKGIRFSFRWDLGTSRFIMIDSRNGRILDDGRHLMLGDREFWWVEEQMRDGAVDHLVLGTSLPWLLPHALGDLQAVNQIAANRPGWRGWLAEKIRQGADLEHWQAFHDSFDRLTRLIAQVATGDPGERSPATVSVLSGDVHHSYAARVDLLGITGNGTDGAARVHQLTCSPVHNKVHWFVKPAFRVGWSRRLARLTERWSRRAGVTPVPITDSAAQFGS
ncbi:MAG TPA: alkaline phosphatase family protein, partial [Methylomirabilota bacterium]|nr:alkaline phosphatase family protein [Methylomirabilota bacterium]